MYRFSSEMWRHWTCKWLKSQPISQPPVEKETKSWEIQSYTSHASKVPGRQSQQDWCHRLRECLPSTFSWVVICGPATVISTASWNRRASHIDPGRSSDHTDWLIWQIVQNTERLMATQLLLSSNVVTAFKWAGGDGGRGWCGNLGVVTGEGNCVRIREEWNPTGVDFDYSSCI